MISMVPDPPADYDPPHGGGAVRVQGERGHRFWTARYAIRVDANRPGIYRWLITLESRMIANASRRPSQRNGRICASVLPGNRSNSAGGVPLGPPAGAARSSLQAAARMTWQADATRQPCVRAATEGVKGHTGRPLGLPVWLSRH
jgi:hypothetical protein